MEMKRKNVGDGTPPAICTPLVGKCKGEIIAELADVLSKKPDMLEWRADFFQDIGNTAEILAVADLITSTARNIPIIFTVRSNREGGEPIPLADEEVIGLCAAVCTHTAIEYIDCELSNSPEHMVFLRDIAHKHNKKIIASFHQHLYTPTKEFLLAKLAEAQEQGMDVAKIAVMPCSMEDIITLLSVSLEANKQLNIPVIVIAMGPYGVITRVAGGVFGSAVTFAVGHKASAPGQVPIDDLRTVLHTLEKSMK